MFLDICNHLKVIEENLTEIRNKCRPVIYHRPVNVKSRLTFAIVDLSAERKAKGYTLKIQECAANYVRPGIMGGIKGRSPLQLLINLTEDSLTGQKIWGSADVRNGFGSVNIQILKNITDKLNLKLDFLDAVNINWADNKIIPSLGLLQGHPCSPVLFNIYTESALNEVIIENEVGIFVDDVILRGESLQSIQEDLAKIELAFNKIGLSFHKHGPKKTTIQKSDQPMNYFGLHFEKGILPSTINDPLYYLITIKRIFKNCSKHKHPQSESFLRNALAWDVESEHALTGKIAIVYCWLKSNHTLLLDKLDRHFSCHGNTDLLKLLNSTRDKLNRLIPLEPLIPNMYMSHTYQSNQSLPTSTLLLNYEFNKFNNLSQIEGVSLDEQPETPLFDGFTYKQKQIRKKIYDRICLHRPSEFVNFDESIKIPASYLGYETYPKEFEDYVIKNKLVRLALKLHTMFIFFYGYPFLTQISHPFAGLSLLPYANKKTIPYEYLCGLYYNELRYVNKTDFKKLLNCSAPKISNKQIQILLRGLCNYVYLRRRFPKKKLRLNDFTISQIGKTEWMRPSFDFKMAKLLSDLHFKKIDQEQFVEKLNQLINS